MDVHEIRQPLTMQSLDMIFSFNVFLNFKKGGRERNLLREKSCMVTPSVQ